MPRLQIKQARSRRGALVVWTSLVLMFTTGLRRQELAYSCELASLVNALEPLGVQVNEQFIWQQITNDPRPRSTDQWGRPAWSNPHKVIVGDLRFVGLANGLSYGTFPRPLARAARAAGVEALAVADLSLAELQSYREHVPHTVGIEIWGTTGGPRQATGWYADDRWIEVTARPHDYNVVAIKDHGIVLGDPLTATERLWSWAQFDAMWTRQAVLVRHKLPWSQSFAETGQTVSGLFLELYRSEGGKTAFGLPLTSAMIEDGKTVQYFERAIMELAPAARGTADEVQLRRVGAALHGIDPAVASRASTLRTRFYPETGHTLSAPFLSYWERNGARDVLGLPISEPQYTEHGLIQWFERARLEVRADGTIERGLLGYEALQAAPGESLPDLRNLGENQARELLKTLGITEIVVDYQGREVLGERFDRIAPYAVVSQLPPAHTPRSAVGTVVLGVRAP